MKRAVLILGGIIAVLVVAVVGVAWFAITGKEKELNRKKTEKAREVKLERVRTPDPDLDEPGNETASTEVKTE